MLGLATIRRTSRISCEAVPASIRDAAGTRRHLRRSHGAAESFISFIRLFGGPDRPRTAYLARPLDGWSTTAASGWYRLSA
jgi:hypothetical protein